MSEFVNGAGYSDKDSSAYNSPVAFAALGLKELSTTQGVTCETDERYFKRRYNQLLDIRERVRSATEKSLNLCPGTLLIDFTTIAQKTESGAHRPHADKCLHYFDAKTKKATCDTTRTHPYPNRVAASILYLNNYTSGAFAEGEFYFANRSDGKVDEIIPMETEKMIYFTSGVESLHGALPVKRRVDSDNAEVPRRLALTMWYVTDPKLEEYVPPFQAKQPVKDAANDGRTKPRKVHDANDPTAPKELFVVPIPKRINIDTLFDAMGAYLVKQAGSQKQWKVLKDGEDTIHMLFQDNSAMFSLDFGVALKEPTAHAESSVVIERHTDGRKPASLQYMLQESVMLHMVLDGLLSYLIKETSSDDEKKYVNGKVEKARSTLPARRA